MWALALECLIGFWIISSYCLFTCPMENESLAMADLIAAAAVVSFALLSLIRRLDKLHLASLLVAGMLIGIGFAPPGFSSPASLQNHLIVGLILAIVCLVPCRANKPPRSWSHWYRSKSTQK